MMPPRSRGLALLSLVVLSAALALPLPASGSAGDDRDDVRRTGTCTHTSETTLRLRTHDGAIRVELEIDGQRPRSRWAVILLHERRIAFRGTLRARNGGALELRRTVPDWPGLDTIAVRAAGPDRETCRVSAAL
jgi:hypothetical protein